MFYVCGQGTTTAGGSLAKTRRRRRAQERETTCSNINSTAAAVAFSLSPADFFFSRFSSERQHLFLSCKYEQGIRRREQGIGDHHAEIELTLIFSCFVSLGMKYVVSGAYVEHLFMTQLNILYCCLSETRYQAYFIGILSCVPRLAYHEPNTTRIHTHQVPVIPGTAVPVTFQFYNQYRYQCRPRWYQVVFRP